MVKRNTKEIDVFAKMIARIIFILLVVIIILGLIAMVKTLVGFILLPG